MVPSTFEIIKYLNDGQFESAYEELKNAASSKPDILIEIQSEFEKKIKEEFFEECIGCMHKLDEDMLTYLGRAVNVFLPAISKKIDLFYSFSSTLKIDISNELGKFKKIYEKNERSLIFNLGSVYSDLIIEGYNNCYSYNYFTQQDEILDDNIKSLERFSKLFNVGNKDALAYLISLKEQKPSKKIVLEHYKKVISDISKEIKLLNELKETTSKEDWQEEGVKGRLNSIGLEHQLRFWRKKKTELEANIASLESLIDIEKL